MQTCKASGSPPSAVATPPAGPAPAALQLQFRVIGCEVRRGRARAPCSQVFYLKSYPTLIVNIRDIREEVTTKEI